MAMNPADHVDAAAFQPSHTLSFELAPGESLELFEEVSPGDVGKVRERERASHLRLRRVVQPVRHPRGPAHAIAAALTSTSSPSQSVTPPYSRTATTSGQVVRGDWFVTSGEELAAVVAVTDPGGGEVYREGPTRPVWRGDEEHQGGGSSSGEGSEPASEGSFRFYCDNPGVLRVVVTNPSDAEARTVTLAWLKGRDDDDPYTADPGGRWDLADSGGGGDPNADALIANPRNASAFVRSMLGRVSSLHKDIDALLAQQGYMSVLYKRHGGTADRVNARVVRWTLAQAAAVVAVTLAQVLAIRRFDLKPSLLGGGGAGGGMHPRARAVLRGARWGWVAA
jgi:hypothetical protein